MTRPRQRLIDLFMGQDLQADDDTFDISGCASEDAVLDQIAVRDWDALIELPRTSNTQIDKQIHRRGLYKTVDRVRNLAGVGDR